MTHFFKRLAPAIMGLTLGVVAAQDQAVADPFIVGWSSVGGSDLVGGDESAGPFLVGHSSVGGSDLVGGDATNSPFTIGTSSVGGPDLVGGGTDDVREPEAEKK